MKIMSSFTHPTSCFFFFSFFFIDFYCRKRNTMEVNGVNCLVTDTLQNIFFYSAEGRNSYRFETTWGRV